jgi:hypothetical protein
MKMKMRSFSNADNVFYRQLKYLFCNFIPLLFIVSVVRAQVPQGIPFQAIARSSSGTILSSQLISARFSFHEDSATGAIVYREVFSLTTSIHGLFTLNIGTGTADIGSFNSINWSLSAKFMQVEIDPAGGTTYTDMGTTQIMSVPYALHSANSMPGGSSGDILYNDGSTWLKLPAGSAGQVLSVNAGLPVWTSSATLFFPVVITTTVSAVSASAATSGGVVNSEGNSTVTARGVVWSLSTNPTVALSTKTTDGTGPGSFTSSITGLSGSSTYYMRAYATNSAGTAYGTQYIFTTSAATIPTAITTTVSVITTSTAASGGDISNDGGAPVTARGVVWSTTTGPTTALSTKTVDGTGTGSFVSSITGLAPATAYFVRAYATNGAGTAYGAQYSFTTSAATVPILTTTAVTAITASTASSGGTITGDGGSAVTVRGVVWGTASNPTTALSTKTNNGTGVGSYTSSITGLLGSTTYFVRAYATNSTGTAYGAQTSFTTTAPTLATLTTTAITAITPASASSGGTISNSGGASVTVRGVCWSTSANPTNALTTKTTDGSGIGVFASGISGITGTTTYYVRAYATNIVGTAYGNEISFTSGSPTLGMFYGGGVVGYITGPFDPGYISGQTHGLIVYIDVPTSSGFSWGCEGTSIGTGTAYGSGAANTTAIVAGCATSGTAARVCSDGAWGLYTDWYLPSKDELNKLYTNRFVINGVFGGAYGFIAAYYWSSSQYDGSQAWIQYFGGGLAQSPTAKSIDGIWVKPVRSF